MPSFEQNFSKMIFEHMSCAKLYSFGYDGPNLFKLGLKWSRWHGLQSNRELFSIWGMKFFFWNFDIVILSKLTFVKNFESRRKPIIVLRKNMFLLLSANRPRESRIWCQILPEISKWWPNVCPIKIVLIKIFFRKKIMPNSDSS